MISLKDIYWAAGFLEGEGCFQEARITPALTAAQVELEPLLKLKALFGGTIRNYTRTNPSSGYVTNYNIWRLYGSPAAGVMMTLYSLLSPKRQNRIKGIIRVWKAAPGHRRDDSTGQYLPKEATLQPA